MHSQKTAAPGNHDVSIRSHCHSHSPAALGQYRITAYIHQRGVCLVGVRNGALPASIRAMILTLTLNDPWMLLLSALVLAYLWLSLRTFRARPTRVTYFEQWQRAVQAGGASRRSLTSARVFSVLLALLIFALLALLASAPDLLSEPGTAGEGAAGTREPHALHIIVDNHTLTGLRTPAGERVLDQLRGKVQPLIPRRSAGDQRWLSVRVDAGGVADPGPWLTMPLHAASLPPNLQPLSPLTPQVPALPPHGAGAVDTTLVLTTTERCAVWRDVLRSAGIAEAQSVLLALSLPHDACGWESTTQDSESGRVRVTGRGGAALQARYTSGADASADLTSDAQGGGLLLPLLLPPEENWLELELLPAEAEPDSLRENNRLRFTGPRSTQRGHLVSPSLRPLVSALGVDERWQHEQARAEGEYVRWIVDSNESPGPSTGLAGDVVWLTAPDESLALGESLLVSGPRALRLHAPALLQGQGESWPLVLDLGAGVPAVALREAQGAGWRALVSDELSGHALAAWRVRSPGDSLEIWIGGGPESPLLMDFHLPLVLKRWCERKAALWESAEREQLLKARRDGLRPLLIDQPLTASVAQEIGRAAQVSLHSGLLSAPRQVVPDRDVLRMPGVLYLDGARAGTPLAWLPGRKLLPADISEWSDAANDAGAPELQELVEYLQRPLTDHGRLERQRLASRTALLRWLCLGLCVLLGLEWLLSQRRLIA